jgi:hypothetical protein
MDLPVDAASLSVRHGVHLMGSLKLAVKGKDRHLWYRTAVY